MVLCWRRYGRAGGCRNPLKNKSKTLSYIKYHLQRCLYTLVFTSDPSSENFWSWMTDKSSVKWYLENWTLKIISSINIELVRDRRISNNEIGRWKEVTFRSSKNKRHPRPLSNINGKTKQFKNNQVCRATLCKTDQTRIARLFCRLSCKERREDALALRADERRDKLRKAAVRSKYPLTRRCLNGETRLSKPQSTYTESIGIRREPGELKHLSSRRKGKKDRCSK